MSHLREQADDIHTAWLTKVHIAEETIPIIGRLYRERNVVPHLHGRSLVNKSAIDIVKAHRWARRVTDSHQVQVSDTLAVVQLAAEAGVTGMSLDIGLLKMQAAQQQRELLAHAREVFASHRPQEPAYPTDVVLYGFGRIGRLLARILIAHQGSGLGLRLRAIVVRKKADNDLAKRASLLRRDSVHGAFDGTIEIDADNDVILANGTRIHVIYANDPADIDYTRYGIHDAIIVDNTGRWRTEEELQRHLRAQGSSRVLLTAPGAGDLPNIVFGINHHEIGASTQIVTAASCTTNAITPVLKVVDDTFGIEHGHVETVHAYTNDQNLIDNFHKGPRRGRSAALNMVITETGAAKAVAKALPQLAGKLSGNAIRVPTPDVSLAILNLTLKRPVTRDDLNDVMRECALTGQLRNQIDFIASPEVVSSDFVGSRRAGIVDGLATISDGTHVVLYVWYDNEYGYSSQVIRVLERMSEVQQHHTIT